MNIDDPKVLAAAYEDLSKHLPLLSPKDQPFAKDMLKAFHKPNHGSPKQKLWLVKMAQKAVEVAAKAEAAKAEIPAVQGSAMAPIQGHVAQPVDKAYNQIQKKKTTFAGFEKLYEYLMFAASNGIKNPRIRLYLSDGSGLMLYISGQNSKKPGVINITDGKPFGESKWYGRIHKNGEWEQPKSYVPKLSEGKDIVQAALYDLVHNPFEALKGMAEVGKCAFCYKSLFGAFAKLSGFHDGCAEKFKLMPPGTVADSMKKKPDFEEWWPGATKKVEEMVEEEKKDKIMAPRPRAKVEYLF